MLPVSNAPARPASTSFFFVCVFPPNINTTSVRKPVPRRRRTHAAHATARNTCFLLISVQIEPCYFGSSACATMSMEIDTQRRNKVPRPLTEAERARLEEYTDSIYYSPRYACFGAFAGNAAARIEKNESPFFCAVAHAGVRYSDDEYEYRHVQLPKAMLKIIPKDYHDTAKGTLKLLWEDEWRGLGITQVRKSFLAASRPPGRVGEGADHAIESRMGALRSPRAGAAHPPLQVSRHNMAFCSCFPLF